MDANMTSENDETTRQPKETSISDNSNKLTLAATYLVNNLGTRHEVAHLAQKVGVVHEAHHLRAV
jgi:hypothetical protein